ncbi:DUF2860 family protein [Helicobacter sp. MIT 21-1697]|uniref:DUF2860 family protein n=1 Tax=Helicobacter sp. MIT 21-1697 TaxID=2993733 RepID=UPI00224AE30B|nr:DUF2860 family protein [Helicobacter sp. MIT 21-1697]MCX2716746.1 DUF2860 family protein [Helicobacter sp. MIT 21-1697]
MYKKFIFLGICLNLVFSQENKNGFQGSVMLGAGVRIINSHLFPQPKHHLKSLEGKADDYYQPIPLIGLDISYNGIWGEDKIFLKGFSGRELGGLKLGYSTLIKKRLRSEFALISSIYERAYANPYIEGAREERSLSKVGFSTTQSYLFSPYHYFFVSYVLQHHDYKGESIPYEALKRNKFLHQGEIGYSFMILKILAHYDYIVADGEAESYSNIGGKIDITIPLMKGTLVFKPSFGYFEYQSQAINPIFDKLRSGFVAQASLSMYKLNFFHPRVLFFASYKKEKRKNNISFYDEDYQYIMSGLGYRF